MELKLGIIADDLTGSNDTGVQFKNQGLRAIVVTELEAVSTIVNRANVIVIDTESRNINPDAAYKRIRDTSKIMKENGIKLIYKKIDSTLRGNIGQELDAIIESGVDLVIVAPAFPENGRTTIGGHQLVDQVPLEKTELAHDPIHPIKESHVPSLIADQTKYKVGYVTLSHVVEGVLSLKHKIEEEQGRGRRIVVVDATTQKDLKTIADVSIALNAIACGSAGLAGELSKAFVSLTRKSVIVISGSVNKVTMQQILRAEKELKFDVIDLDATMIVGDATFRKREKDRVINATLESIVDGGDVVVRSASSLEEVRKALKQGRRMELNKHEVSSIVASVLGEIALVAASRDILCIVLTGGETAIGAIGKMDALGMEIEEEVLPGITLCRVIGGEFDGMRIITKAGGFGDENALIKIMRNLRRYR